ncbi:acyloxyacyl hydrolase [uncultured Alsobacter sp.]|uniref:acyloxyacyl hydrolase n=1 Tax=uncultured Alsobacter sp. TaxID=1748258 RepID=UPI0025DAEE6A|nr:acyloxyacyl hydrolase [uncultured Alsobacter sp.]
MMRVSTGLGAFGVFAVVMSSSLPSLAADLGASPVPRAPVFTTDGASRFEIRGGVFAHDPWSPEQGSADLNLEALSPRLFTTGSSWDVLIPRAHVGGTINFNGKTSHGYAGLTWTYDVTQQIFVEASFGGAVHNGKTDRIVPVNHNALGCSPLFRESASIGYRFNQAWSVMASVEHLSNAGLCSNNRGLTNAGVRLGYSF